MLPPVLSPLSADKSANIATDIAADMAVDVAADIAVDVAVNFAVDVTVDMPMVILGNIHEVPWQVGAASVEHDGLPRTCPWLYPKKINYVQLWLCPFEFVYGAHPS